jgi:hypothetical protein
MAAVTDSEMLTKVNEAIQACLLGQSYEINGRRMTRADLPDLLNAEKFYQERVNRALSSPADHGFGLVSFDGPI